MKELLARLRDAGIQLGVEDGRLAVAAPRGALTPELRAALAAHKERLLRMLQNAAEPSEVVLLEPRPEARHEPFALTEVQQAYWLGRYRFIELGGISTHVYTELEREGFDLPRLERALQRTIERHDMLRAIVTDDGQQRILPQVPPYRIAVHDLRGLQAARRDEVLLRLRYEVAHRLLPLGQWPLFEVQAARLDGGRTRLFICFDMLIADASSMVMVSKDWERYYEQPTWSPAPLQLSYRDYAAFEQALRQQPAGQRARAYWQQRLGDLPPPPALPLACSPAALDRVVLVRHEVSLDAPRWTRLKDEARRQGATASVLLMTAFCDVLRAWSRQAEFTLNLTMFTRHAVHPEVGQLIGDFTSTNLLAVRAQAGEPFVERLRRVQAQLAQDLEHRQYSGMSVLRDRARRLGAAPAASMPVVFTSTLALDGQEATAGGIAFGGELIAGLSETPQVWLDHQMSERHGQLMLYWDAVEALFPPGVLEQMLGLYWRWLCRLADDAASWSEVSSPDLPEVVLGVEPRPLALAQAADAARVLPPDVLRAADPALEPMRALWQQVLGHGDLDATSSFFAAGGDSLNAIRLADLARRRFGLAHCDHARVLEQLFTHPSLASFTAALQAMRGPMVAEGAR